METEQADGPTLQAVGEQQKDSETAELEERIRKLAEKGLWDPLTLLKMRLDLVAMLLVPDSLVGTLEGTWSQLVDKHVEQLETQLNRQTLLEGVHPAGGPTP